MQSAHVKTQIIPTSFGINFRDNSVIKHYQIAMKSGIRMNSFLGGLEVSHMV